MNRTIVTVIKKAGLVCAVFILLVPVAVPSIVIGRAVLWCAFWGPPVDLDAPHDGRVVAHIDYLGTSGPCRVKPECWNRCWSLTLQAGENAASFWAGPQQFQAQVPQGSPSFVLV